MTLGDLIKEYRQNQGLTMQEFALKSGLSKGYISMLEKGKHPQNNKTIIPSLNTYNMIAKSIGITLNEILAAVDSEQPIDITKEELSFQDPPSPLLKEEEILLDKYRGCSTVGKKKIHKYVDNVYEMEQAEKAVSKIYEEQADYLTPVAAHNDNLSDEQLELMNNDLEKLKDL